MSKSTDVFSSLNDFLSKDDDSFSFSSEIENPLFQPDTDSENDSNITKKIKKPDVSINVPDSKEIVDLSKIDYNFIPKARTRVSRKSTRLSVNIPTYDDLSIIEVVPTKRRRLKIPEVCAKLSSDDSSKEENTAPRTRSGKTKKPQTKTKAKPIKKATKKGIKMDQGHLSLEAAMALVEQSITAVVQPVISPSRKPKTVISDTHVEVDLTGGATPPHSSSPLFKPRNQYFVPTENSFEIESVNIKLKLDGKVEIHTMQQHQKFIEVFKAVAETHNISTNDVLIYNDSKRIHYDDTPHSIGYRASIFLTCRIMEKSGTGEVAETFRRCRNENEIEIKVQSDKWSRPLKITISKVENFQVALEIIAETVKFKVEQMRLIFDGETIDVNETPLDLEFEGGEIVDCKIID